MQKTNTMPVRVPRKQSVRWMSARLRRLECRLRSSNKLDDRQYNRLSQLRERVARAEQTESSNKGKRS